MLSLRALLIVATATTLVSCGGLKIGESKVPFEKICGRAGDKECRCVGRGIGQTYRQYKKEIPPSDGTKFGNLGRIDNEGAFYDPVAGLKVDSSDIAPPRRSTIAFDLQKDMVAQVAADLGAELSKQGFDAGIKAGIVDSFKVQMKKVFSVDAQFVTVTFKEEIIDAIDEVSQGQSVPDVRIAPLVEKLKAEKKPLIIVSSYIEETGSYTKGTSLQNVLKLVIDAKIGASTQKGTALVNGVLSSNTAKRIESSYTIATVYSYGYLKKPWFYTPR
jgi:hypothetical protein